MFHKIRQQIATTYQPRLDSKTRIENSAKAGKQTKVVLCDEVTSFRFVIYVWSSTYFSNFATTNVASPNDMGRYLQYAFLSLWTAR